MDVRSQLCDCASICYTTVPKLNAQLDCNQTLTPPPKFRQSNTLQDRTRLQNQVNAKASRLLNVRNISQFNPTFVHFLDILILRGIYRSHYPKVKYDDKLLYVWGGYVDFKGFRKYRSNYAGVTHNINSQFLIFFPETFNQIRHVLHGTLNPNSHRRTRVMMNYSLII